MKRLMKKLQYSVLATLVDSLRMVYPSLSKEDIVGHSDIAPGRKTDPGPRISMESISRTSGLRGLESF